MQLAHSSHHCLFYMHGHLDVYTDDQVTTISWVTTVQSDCFNYPPSGQSYLQVPRCAACYNIYTKGGRRKSILVSGTHIASTTTSLLSHKWNCQDSVGILI